MSKADERRSKAQLLDTQDQARSRAEREIVIASDTRTRGKLDSTRSLAKFHSGLPLVCALVSQGCGLQKPQLETMIGDVR